MASPFIDLCLFVESRKVLEEEDGKKNYLTEWFKPRTCEKFFFILFFFIFIFFNLWAENLWKNPSSSSGSGKPW